MKLKSFIPLFIAMLALMTSCADEASMTLLDEIQVSSLHTSLFLWRGKCHNHYRNHAG